MTASSTALVPVPRTPGTIRRPYTPLHPAVVERVSAELRKLILDWMWESFPNDADDVFQDAWVVVLGRLEIGLFATLLLLPKIARDARSQFFRKRARRNKRRRRVDDLESCFVDGGPSPEECTAEWRRAEQAEARVQAERTETWRSAVLAETGNLADPIRVVVLAVHIDGQKHREAAAALGISKGQVAGRLRTAYRALRRALPAPFRETGSAGFPERARSNRRARS